MLSVLHLNTLNAWAHRFLTYTPSQATYKVKEDMEMWLLSCEARLLPAVSISFLHSMIRTALTKSRSLYGIWLPCVHPKLHQPARYGRAVPVSVGHSYFGSCKVLQMWWDSSIAMLVPGMICTHSPESLDSTL